MCPLKKVIFHSYVKLPEGTQFSAYKLGEPTLSHLVVDGQPIPLEPDLRPIRLDEVKKNMTKWTSSTELISMFFHTLPYFTIVSCSASQHGLHFASFCWPWYAFQKQPPTSRAPSARKLQRDLEQCGADVELQRQKLQRWRLSYHPDKRLGQEAGWTLFVCLVTCISCIVIINCGCCDFIVLHYTIIYILWYTRICYYMLLYAIICYHMLLFAIICYYMLLYAIICYYMLLYAIICYYMLLYAIICYYTLLYAIICYYMLLYAIICYYMLLYA